MEGSSSLSIGKPGIDLGGESTLMVGQLNIIRREVRREEVTYMWNRTVSAVNVSCWADIMALTVDCDLEHSI